MNVENVRTVYAHFAAGERVNLATVSQPCDDLYYQASVWRMDATDAQRCIAALVNIGCLELMVTNGGLAVTVALPLNVGLSDSQWRAVLPDIE